MAQQARSTCRSKRKSPVSAISPARRICQRAYEREVLRSLSSIDEATAGAILTIDLSALAANWRFLRDKVQQGTPAAECAAVVKADAYGIGLEPAVRALTKAGCRTFFVAHVSEA